jgi:aldose 1-epimerase
VDRWTLSLPADRLVLVDDRLLPTGTAPVAESPAKDFRSPRPVGDAMLDDAFTGLAAGPDGRFRASVVAADGTGTVISWDPAVLPWTQVYSSDKPGTPFHRSGLAVEPMTCPANAFNSGDGLVVLAPGAEHRASWLIGAVEA